MRERTITGEDYSTALVDLPPARLPWLVTSVKAMPNYSLKVSFIDGLEGYVQMQELIFSENAGVFSKLCDPQAFAKVFIDGHAVNWANGLDLAPDAMHDEIARNGVWTLR